MGLFFNRRQEIPEDRQIVDLPLAQITENRYQPRRQFSDESINELAQTLSQDGLLQPIIVRKHEDGYEIIAGERRFRAAKSLNWESIPAIVKDMTDEQSATLALIENLQRENLNPIDEAKAYEQLMEINDYTQSDLAQGMGKSQSYIANKLRLLKLSPKVQSFLVTGQITQRHGRALLGLSQDVQDQVVDEILAQNLNVLQTEELVKQLANQKQADKQKVKTTIKHVKSNSGDLQMQINTIKQAVKLAKDSGIKVKMHEEKDADEYRITIELKRS